MSSSHKRMGRYYHHQVAVKETGEVYAIWSDWSANQKEEMAEDFIHLPQEEFHSKWGYEAYLYTEGSFKANIIGE